jgi:hypothetical protein
VELTDVTLPGTVGPTEEVEFEDVGYGAVDSTFEEMPPPDTEDELEVRGAVPVEVGKLPEPVERTADVELKVGYGAVEVSDEELTVPETLLEPVDRMTPEPVLVRLGLVLVFDLECNV